MTGISRAICGVVAVGCGYVLFGAPSEVDQLAIGMALGRTPALVLLALVVAGSLGALVSCRCPRVTATALVVAAAALWAYAILAVALKGGVALPTAALALGVGLRYGEIAGELRTLGFQHGR